MYRKQAGEVERRANLFPGKAFPDGAIAILNLEEEIGYRKSKV